MGVGRRSDGNGNFSDRPDGNIDVSDRPVRHHRPRHGPPGGHEVQPRRARLDVSAERLQPGVADGVRPEVQTAHRALEAFPECPRQRRGSLVPDGVSLQVQLDSTGAQPEGKRGRNRPRARVAEVVVSEVEATQGRRRCEAGGERDQARGYLRDISGGMDVLGASGVEAAGRFVVVVPNRRRRRTKEPRAGLADIVGGNVEVGDAREASVRDDHRRRQRGCPRYPQTRGAQAENLQARSRVIRRPSRARVRDGRGAHSAEGITVHEQLT